MTRNSKLNSSCTTRNHRPNQQFQILYKLFTQPLFKDAFISYHRGIPWNRRGIFLDHLAFRMLINICQFALFAQLSANPENVVITIVRNKAATQSKITAEIPGRKNITVIQGDLANLDSLKVSSTKPPDLAAPLRNGTPF
jgi:hypothetical protein